LKEVDAASKTGNEEYRDRDLEKRGEQATFTAEDGSMLARLLNERIAALDQKDVDSGIKKLKRALSR